VLTARSELFDRLPADLQSHVAFKHFYTHDLKGSSGELSLRYFSLFIAYFCALCRLEGRRRHYLQSPSDKSGASFARAHNRARQVFQRLNGAYSAILMRYNMHSTLDIPKKPRVVRRAGHAPAVVEDTNTTGRYAVGAKSLGPPVSKVRPFEYAADELRFYEELYVFTEQLLRLAFTDDRLQGPITAEVNNIFRGQRFNFGPLAREASIRKAAAELTATSLSATSGNTGGGAANELDQNMRHLAEVLVPPAPKVSIKEAAVQRTPFVASRFNSGKMSMKKYSRPATALGSVPRTSTERNALLVSQQKSGGGTGLRVEDGAPADGPIQFPPTHRAVASFLNPRPLSMGGASSVGSAMMVSRAISRLKGADAARKKHAVHGFLPKLQDFDVVDQPPAPTGGDTSSPGELSPRDAPPDSSVLISGDFAAPAALQQRGSTPLGLRQVSGVTSHDGSVRHEVSSNAGRSLPRSMSRGSAAPGSVGCRCGRKRCTSPPSTPRRGRRTGRATTPWPRSTRCTRASPTASSSRPSRSPRTSCASMTATASSCPSETEK
jgi:hypothetical protein